MQAGSAPRYDDLVNFLLTDLPWMTRMFMTDLEGGHVWLEAGKFRYGYGVGHLKLAGEGEEGPCSGGHITFLHAAGW